jgi:hypothetical protein
MSKITDQIIATAIAFVLLAANWCDWECVRKMGKDKLGETVKQFQIHHPKAICGKFVFDMEVNAKNLVDAKDRADLNTNCCLNDRDSLKEISPFPILNLNNCAFHAMFSKRGLLCNLDYMLDVRSLKTVLPDFKEFYGEPDRMGTDPQDQSKLTFFDWTRGGTYLDVQLSRMGRDSTHPNGEPWLETVSVSLYDTDMVGDRR